MYFLVEIYRNQCAILSKIMKEFENLQNFIFGDFLVFTQSITDFPKNNTTVVVSTAPVFLSNNFKKWKQGL